MEGQEKVEGVKKTRDLTEEADAMLVVSGRRERAGWGR